MNINIPDIFLPDSSSTISKITTDAQSSLFPVIDFSKPVPNELIFTTFGTIFLVSVIIAVGIRKYAIKKGFKQKT